MNVFPFDDGVWAQEPRNVLKPVNNETRSPKIRYTWAGPIDPQVWTSYLLFIFSILVLLLTLFTYLLLVLLYHSIMV